jgi:HD superfamily phosphohydrolase
VSERPAFEVIRDPLWDNIRLDDAALAVIDVAVVQRLRYVRQLGHAFLVYPGATHSRFEHALGTYHLTKQALAILQERGELDDISEEDHLATRLAALLHDIGHYPFSHSLEEAGFPHHESLGVAKLKDPELADRLDDFGVPDLAQRVGGLIEGTSPSPLAGLISGTLDLDKIDYLSRDARMCGVPYGTVDVDRLLAALTLCRPADRDALVVGVREKGLSALESLLFSRYQMYRNVYWHHAVRSATCMFKRAVRTAVGAGRLDAAWIANANDGALTEQLLAADTTGLATAVYHRRLYKRAADIPGGQLPEDIQPWVTDDVERRERVEDAMAAALGLPPGGLLIDLPSRRAMFGVHLPLATRRGSVEWLTGPGRAGEIGLRGVAEELYHSAQRLRVFVATPVAVSQERLLDTVTLPADEIDRRWGEGVSAP